ncbi:exopolyphosphatase [Demequina aurantiaca]|uniref:Ppx/GppA phosphatase family protein n=1 Tax=Demequina aurantiaca TaxID=676200 RepID=UPI003D332D83
MTRVAAVDCGTNSIRLLIADVSADGSSLTDVLRTMTVVRLGQGVDKTGEFAADALERTFAAVDEYEQECREHDVTAIRFVATSATRDARNRGDFIEGVQSRLGVTPEVITGDEEAELSFRGAVSVIDPARPAPYLVVDLGGGSTEMVLGERSPASAHSMNVGCVRMSERHLVSDPPTDAEIAAAKVDVDVALDLAMQSVDVSQARSLVGLAGTITTVTAHALGLSGYDRDAINGASVSIDDAIESCETLLHATRAEREAMPFMHPGRVDVIGAGALVWSAVMKRVREQVVAAGGELDATVTSEHDILDGIAFSAAARG